MSGRERPLRAKSVPRSLMCQPGTECVPIFHITHVENLGPILNKGLVSHNECVSKGVRYHRIGDADIKETRSSFPVRAQPFGFLGDYVPFYLGPRSPMQYRIHMKSVAGYDGSELEVIFLVSSVETLLRQPLTCVHTNGQANARFTQHFQGLEGIEANVEWEVIRGKYWHSTAQYPDRMRKRLAEVLVHKSFPFDAVEGIAVANEAMAQRVNKVLISNATTCPVMQKPAWYYGGPA
jgi:hypothetical protein